MQRLFILLSAFFLTSIFYVSDTYGQVDPREFKRMEKEANGHFEIDEFYLALPLYKKLDSLQPNNSFYNMRLGICYLQTQSRKKALPYLQKVTEAEIAKNEYFFYLGRALHLNHEFTSAQTQYVKFRQALENDKSLEKYCKLTELDRYIKNCENAKLMVANPIPEFYIENLGEPINSPYPDFVPVVSADETELIFTSKRPDTNGGGKDPEDGQYFEDMYVSTRNDPTEPWSVPQNMGPTINQAGHDASVALSADGLELFIYRNSTSKFGELFAGDIYQSEKRSGVWKEPVKMKTGINSDSWEPHASISSDEKVLYFTSNRSGGYGGLDIYRVRRLPNGDWALPENLGPSINTPFDEDAPFIHPDANNNTLYFSSKGHNSMGGYDVFRTSYSPLTNEWTSPENIGYPINSADDDIYFVWSADGTRAYFSSVRDDSYGDLDIYVVNLPEKSSSVMLVKGRILDDETEEPVPAVITVRDNETSEIVGIYNPDVTNGSYKILLPLGKNYGLSIDAENYLFYSENINIPNDLIYTQVIKDIRLSHILVGKQSILRNVFFDFNKAILRKESEPELDKVFQLLKDNPRLIVEIGGHTDNIGSAESNKKISEDRAKSVVAYLVNKGIDSTRMFPFGYGFDFPLVENIDESSRQLNRRTELIILDSRRAEELLRRNKGYYNEMKEQDSSFTLIGSVQAMKIIKGRALQYKKRGQDGVVELVNQAEEEEKEEAISKAAAEKKAAKDTENLVKKERDKAVSDSIASLESSKKKAIEKSKSGDVADETPRSVLAFAFDKYDITRTNALILDSLASVLKSNPDLKLHFEGFTDNTGDPTYNKQLSLLRAKACKNYLVSKGIEKDRMITEGLGIENPRYTNTTMEGRRKNRRVEALFK
jgi:outer membrane protein OmpA-like peptidoglycan-associated protein/tetratricopeptide (TPR) repeat protein